MNAQLRNPNLPRRALLAGAALGLLGGLALGRRRAAPPRATRVDLWQRLLARRLGTVEAALLAARVQTRYETLHAQRPRFGNLALRLHLDHNLLPGLALYQVLRETQPDAQSALGIWDELVGAREGSPARWGLRLIEHWPGAFRVFRLVARNLMIYGFPRDGWSYKWVEDSDRRLAFDIDRCFYLTVLTDYGAPELTEHFCRLDDLAAEALPPSIRWDRTTSLGRGGARCDFCWTHVTPAPAGARL